MSRTNVQIKWLKMAENRFMAGIAMILSIILQSYNHFYSIFREEFNAVLGFEIQILFLELRIKIGAKMAKRCVLSRI